MMCSLAPFFDYTIKSGMWQLPDRQKVRSAGLAWVNVSRDVLLEVNFLEMMLTKDLVPFTGKSSEE